MKRRARAAQSRIRTGGRPGAGVRRCHAPARAAVDSLSVAGEEDPGAALDDFTTPVVAGAPQGHPGGRRKQD